MAFTNGLISSVDLGTWDYFVMSDNTAVWRAMNGLAAWFSGSSGLIQGAAFMGSLITLAMILFGAATHSKSVGTGTLGGWFFFMSMMGVTGQAQVMNIYTNQVTIINNVPALALLPASMFSKAAYTVFTSMETAFQTTAGSYMSVDQNAFVGPLDILLSLRSPAFASYQPALNKTLVQVVHDCAVDPSSAVVPPPLENSPDAVAWLQQYGRQNGLTKIYRNTDTTAYGTMSDCASALTYVNDQYQEFTDPTSAGLAEFINGVTTKKNPQAADGRWDSGAVQTSFDFLAGTVPALAQSAQQFTKNALTATTISYTMDCVTQSGMLTSVENCQAGSLAAADGKERWKTEAAMAGSGFLKTMFTSMGFLQVLFFALFPFIAIYGLVVVNKTMAVFGGYVLIGIWSQSWMIIVAPIQAYIQTSVIDDMTKALSSSHAITTANMGAVYEKLSTNLAIASDMMANAQMLSLALLSGSVFALSSLAGKWGGTGHNDSSLLNVKPLENSPMYKSGGVGGAVSNFRNDHGGITQTLDAPGAAVWSTATTYTTNRSEVAGDQKSRVTSQQRSDSLSASVRANTGFALSKEDSASIIKSQDAATSFTGGISAGVAGDILKGLNKAGALKGLSGKALEDVTGTVKKAQGAAVSQLAAKDSSFISKLSSANAEERGEAWGKVAETAVDMLTVGAMAAEFLTGVGAAATPATLAIGMAARGGIRAAVKGSVSASTKKAGAETAKKEAGVMFKLSHLPGAIADGVAGNVDAMAKAVLTEGIKKSNSYNASKKNTLGKDVGVNEMDGLTKAVTGSVAESFSKTSGKGETTTASTTLDHASLSRMGTSGFNGKSSDQLRQDAATSSAMLRSGQIKKANGSAFTKDEIAAADQAVAAGMLGHSSSDAGLDQFKKNVMFEQALTNSVNNSLGSSGPGIPVGANFTNGMKVESVPDKPAVAATKGHWAKNGKQQTPKDEALTLKKWGDGGDPQNKAASGAAKEGLHWVPETAAQAGSEGGLRLQDESQAHANVNTTAPAGGIGAGMENGKGGAAFQAVEARIIPSADKALELQKNAALPADTALAKLSPTGVAEFDDKKTAVIGWVAAAGVAKVAGDVVDGLLNGGGAGSPASTGGATAGQPAPAPGKGRAPATPASPAQRTPLNRARVLGRKK